MIIILNKVTVHLHVVFLVEPFVPLCYTVLWGGCTVRLSYINAVSYVERVGVLLARKVEFKKNKVLANTHSLPLPHPSTPYWDVASSVSPKGITFITLAYRGN